MKTLLDFNDITFQQLQKTLTDSLILIHHVLVFIQCNRHMRAMMPILITVYFGQLNETMAAMGLDIGHPDQVLHSDIKIMGWAN